jgi:ABC-type sugar transport system ATPase subunit
VVKVNKKEVFLEIRNVSKTFPGVKALDNMQLDVIPGEVHALIGENGAGKSTLIKILSGIYKPDDGAEIYIEGEKIEINDSLVSVRKGIAVIYQDFSLFPNLTVTENIAISQEIEKSSKKLNWAEMRKVAKKALDRIGVDIDLDIQVGKLSVAKQQLVAIARSLVYDAKMIIMDEPTSALSKGEVEGLFKIVRGLQQNGIAIIFVSHKLEELFQIAQRFTVMRDGRYIGTYDKDELDQDKLIALMVGRKIELKKYEKTKIDKVVLEVKSLSKKGNFKDISFTLNGGEILGFTGLVGAGRTEVMQSLFGITTPDEGQILIEGKEVKIVSTEDAVKHGIAFVPEGRLTEGLIMRQSLANNISVTVLEWIVNKFNVIDIKKKKDVDEGWIDKLRIRPGIPEMDVQKLSGGNQQRVVIAKWLATNPKILIIDEPTNGIDVGAKEEIHRLLKDLASKGMAIIMISSELPEILALSDRIMVMRRGRIVAEFDGDKATQEMIMNKAVLNAG